MPVEAFPRDSEDHRASLFTFKIMQGRGCGGARWYKREGDTQQKAEDVYMMGRQALRPSVWRVTHVPVRTWQTLKLDQ